MIHSIKLLLCTVVAAGALSIGSQAQKKLTTTFADNNGGSTGWGNMFDMRVTNEKGISIVGLEVHTNATAATVNTPITIDFYTCPVTYLGNEVNAAAWTLLTSATGPGMLRKTPTPIAFTTPVNIPAGNYGVAVYMTGLGPVYTGLASSGPPAIYSNADITLSLGNAKTLRFMTGGSTFYPRTWNGSIIYNTASGSSAYSPYGVGCAGTNGVPKLDQTGGSWPKINTVLSQDVSNLPTTPGTFAMLLGVSNSTWGSIPLPFDATSIGMPGCALFASIEAVLYQAHAGSTTKVLLSIPNTPAFVGAVLYMQAVINDRNANGLGWTLTNAAEVTIGS